jgi:hypothetical protein
MVLWLSGTSWNGSSGSVSTTFFFAGLRLAGVAGVLGLLDLKTNTQFNEISSLKLVQDKFSHQCAMTNTIRLNLTRTDGDFCHQGLDTEIAQKI